MSFSSRRTRAFFSLVGFVALAMPFAILACTNDSSSYGSGSTCNPDDNQPPIMKVSVTDSATAAPITATDVTFTSGTTTLEATCEDNDAADGCDGIWYVTVDPTQTTVQVTATGYNPGTFSFLTTSDSCGASLTTYTATVVLTSS